MDVVWCVLLLAASGNFAEVSAHFGSKFTILDAVLGIPKGQDRSVEDLERCVILLVAGAVPG